MTMTVTCSDLGIMDCNYEAHGETSEEVLKNMVEHLRDHHSMDIKEDDVLVGDRSVSEAVSVVVMRLRQELELGPSEEEAGSEKNPLLKDL